ncbi:YadA-like family protein [Haemophilus haemolyticus]|uniref:YadA-like family protein n=1 Tax=Haemophilus haemolyticus TaxID=726 RepID=UPI000E57F972|nr:YadA-like family protein [Haemophilus haemolyticus]
MALGDESQVLNQSNGQPSHASVAIGGLAKAQNLGSIAIGYKSEAGLDNATTGEQGDAFSYAIGREAKAPKSGLAFGSEAEALGNEAIAIGTYSYSKDGIGAMAIGVGSRVAVLEKGKSNKIDNQNSKVLEVDAEGRVNKISVDRTSEADIIKKSGATYGALAFGWKASSHNLFATSIGAFSTVAAIEGTAVGGGTQVTGYRGSAFGMHSKAQAEKSLALGYESEATAYNSVALGASSLANRPNTVSVGDGNYNLYRQITNVADGTEDYDAVNVRQLNALKAETQKITPRIEKIEQRNDAMTQEYRTGIDKLEKRSDAMTQEYRTSIDKLEKRSDAMTQEYRTGIDKLEKRSDTIVKEHRSRIEHIEKRNQQMTKEYRSGIASAIAIGGLQSASIPGKQGVSVGVGNFKGANSLAVGYSRLSSDGSVSLKINAALSSSGYSGGGASVGFMW